MNGTRAEALSISELYSQIGAFCGKWEEPNHVLFQVANAALLLSYLAPPGIYGQIFLRSTLTIGCVLFVIWAWIILCAWDVVLWNAIFALINFGYFLYIIYSLHPFIRFPHEVDLVYQHLFKPLNVSKRSFRKIYKCMRQIDTLKPFDVYW